MADDQAYTGRAGPRDTGNSQNALEFVIAQALAQLSTATYVQVVKAPYDKNGAAITPGTAGAIGFVDVLPLVNQLDGSGNAVEHETVYRLKYHRYGSGNGAFISDPVINDVGVMVVADRDLSVVKSTGKQGNPGSRRKFDKADGTYFGMVIQGTPAQFFAWLAQGFQLQDSFGNVLQGTANGVLINGTLIRKSDGDIITKHGVNVDTHTHNQGTDSAGDVEQPTNAPNTGT